MDNISHEVGSILFIHVAAAVPFPKCEHTILAMLLKFSQKWIKKMISPVANNDHL